MTPPPPGTEQEQAGWIGKSPVRSESDPLAGKQAYLPLNGRAPGSAGVPAQGQVARDHAVAGDPRRIGIAPQRLADGARTPAIDRLGHACVGRDASGRYLPDHGKHTFLEIGGHAR